ncbi:MAG: non-canonical purine NTP pyrophosphatase [Planctomycetota bacterium]
MKLLLATNNRHKRDELQTLLAGLPVEVVTPEGVGGVPDVDEDQPTFAGNARKKAVSAARARGLWSLADDSGLEVEHLDGAPGVRSARFAGTHGDDAANNALLLERLAGVPAAERRARFVTVLALATPAGDVVLELEGEARGCIRTEPSGSDGFGYDPLFEFTEDGFPQTGRTFAEIPRAEKGAVSHRGRALRALLARLPDVLSEGAHQE